MTNNNPGLPLFRREAIEAATGEQEGTILITQSGLYIVLTVFLVIFSFIFVIAVGVTSVSQYTQVSGYLVPDKGTIKTYAVKNGIVDKLNISQGQRVEKGDVLLTLSVGDRYINGNKIDEDIVNEIRSEMKMINFQIGKENQLIKSDQEAFEQRIKAFKREKKNLLNRISLQNKVVLIYESQMNRKQLLLEKGGISKSQFENDMLTFMSEKVNLEELKQQYNKVDFNISDSKIGIKSKILEREMRISTLESEISKSSREILRTSSQLAFSITAPVSGTVSAVQAIPGLDAQKGDLLVVIVPDDAKLVASLLVSARSSGLIKVGQEVILRYPSFPFERYGQQKGKVIQVTRSVFSPDEISSTFQATEPVYKVTVVIDEQNVSSGGDVFELLPGMKVEADVIHERVTVFDRVISTLKAGIYGKS